MCKRFSLLPKLALVSLVAFFLSASALDLHQAKQQGLLGEQPDGYLGLVQENAEARAVMQDINAKRKSAYEALAKQNGVSINQVSAMAGKQALEKTEAGLYIKDSNSQWHKK